MNFSHEKMIFTNTFAQYEKLLLQSYYVSSTIRHKGERGRQREDGLLRFLRDNLPDAYGVVTGEVIPYRGGIASPQCDIIIYDRLKMPILGKKDVVQQVPLEAVYCIIECKSLIDSKALLDFQKKISLIRSLPRCPSRTKLRRGKVRGPIYTLFGYHLKSSKDACLGFMSKAAIDYDVGVVALDTGLGVWVSDGNKPTWLIGTNPSTGYYETLLLFFVSLLEDLRSIDLGNPSFLDMFIFYEK